MEESIPPPIPQQVTTPPTAKVKRWWGIWIASTAIIPAVILAAVPLLPNDASVGEAYLVLTGGSSFVLHLVSSIKLGKGRTGGLLVGLIIGGWALMLVSLFAGCLALVAQG